MEHLIQVFVYGTLKPGERYYDVYCRDRVLFVREAIALGQLYDLAAGYPAMTPGDGSVHGFLLAFNDADVLRDLDEYEGYNPLQNATHNEYERVWVEIFDCDRISLGYAWTYQMTAEQAQAWGGRLLPEGRWFSQKA